MTGKVIYCSSGYINNSNDPVLFLFFSIFSEEGGFSSCYLFCVDLTSVFPDFIFYHLWWYTTIGRSYIRSPLDSWTFLLTMNPWLHGFNESIKCILQLILPCAHLVTKYIIWLCAKRKLLIKTFTQELAISVGVWWRVEGMLKPLPATLTLGKSLLTSNLQFC